MRKECMSRFLRSWLLQQLRDAYKILNPKGEIDAYCEIQDYGYRLGACYDDDLRFCACLGV